ncbi:MAG: hypothetical protein N2C14_06105, partial [Planctomycetales bacterium]
AEKAIALDPYNPKNYKRLTEIYEQQGNQEMIDEVRRREKAALKKRLETLNGGGDEDLEELPFQPADDDDSL